MTRYRVRRGLETEEFGIEPQEVLDAFQFCEASGLCAHTDCVQELTRILQFV